MVTNPPFAWNVSGTERSSSFAAQMCTPPGKPTQACVGLSGPILPPPTPSSVTLSAKVCTQVGGGAELCAGADNKGSVHAQLKIPLGK
ncbi:hypothetical protein L211DRAFT_833035 [Terfezia boudieri ATCC MYA-4762]|uniref:Uncharacterized protein n=1 Tax=Terfezia boudieri ATCC MYA-4762 TaxID=1051890 RepID=A0A3N4M1X1_9PEZI|nr:hypothetical protein L211DRAFT_833035 [Terfezia boudieri ATCC MYA-4762]